MTTTDKTGEQLVQSIRKTKATGTTRSRTTAPRSSEKAKPAVADTAPATADPYQHGRRVWPD
ncbi:MAG: hypothetical protein QNJ87_04975 [Gammaproteobacteria bacterium]|nr:hypothetical protein [Gammaproteobacteria bacterium]MDJ0871100.1 hypothetical protein [Gammaproteobacteria bacterium]MDJ0892228.1 hypothetical protein [Gammaproteobacteria bacterium]